MVEDPKKLLFLVIFRFYVLNKAEKKRKKFLKINIIKKLL